MGRLKGLTPTQRTLRAMREQGRVCAIVEKFNYYAGPFGRREDLFGIIDILALDPQKGVLGIQSAGQDFSKHLKKLLEDKSSECITWLSTPGTGLELWGWRKVKLKKGGKAERWMPRIKKITLKDFQITKRTTASTSE